MLKIIIKENKQKLNTYQQKNLDFIQQNAWPGGDLIANTFLTGLRDSSKSTELLQTIVTSIPAFSNSLIVKAIAGRSYGQVFLLRSGEFQRILKIFTQGIEGGEKDFRWYKKMYDRLHTGKANRSTLMVYDLGKFDTINGNYKWVEMGQLQMLQDYIEETGRQVDIKKLSQDLQRIANTYTMYTGAYGTPADVSQAVGELIKVDKIHRGMNILNKGEVKGLIKSLHDLTSNNEEIKDFFPRNIGVLTPDPTTTFIHDVPDFVIFDN